MADAPDSNIPTELETTPIGTGSMNGAPVVISAVVRRASTRAGTIASSSTAIVGTSPLAKGKRKASTVADAPLEKETEAVKKPKKAISDFFARAPAASTSNAPKLSKAMAAAKPHAVPADFTPAGFSAGLSAEKRASGVTERELLALEVATMGPSWLAALQDELRKSYFLELKEFLWGVGVREAAGEGDKKSFGKVYPSPRDIYTWSRETPLDQVKVVVIGQDPYHGPSQAHGLSFSVQPGVAIPPSLRNIYAEMAASVPGFVKPTHGCLLSLARNGVLLLNTSLTVNAGQAGSHSGKGWETFTQKVVEEVAKGKGVVFLAWGGWAAKRVEGIDKNKHLILKSAHPSPLSAHRGFLGNGHFVKANEWLRKTYGAQAEVDWKDIQLPDGGS